MTDDLYNGLTQLGRASTIAASPDAAVIEKVPNPEPAHTYAVRFVAPEFTSLCPADRPAGLRPSGDRLRARPLPGRKQVAEAVPRLLRNHGAFHEACTVGIARPPGRRDCTRLAAHRRLLVSARRHPDRTCSTRPARPPPGCGLPDQGSAALSWTRLNSSTPSFGVPARRASTSSASRPPFSRRKSAPGSTRIWPPDIRATWIGWRASRNGARRRTGSGPKPGLSSCWASITVPKRTLWTMRKIAMSA